jgi:hypothetical protein
LFVWFQLFAYDTWGSDNLSSAVPLLVVAGALVNGPYALITTAVSAQLGTHPSLEGSNKALATVTAIIDGTGSIGKQQHNLQTKKKKKIRPIITRKKETKKYYTLGTTQLI